MRRTLLASGAGVVVAVVFVAFAVAPALAEASINQIGWWSRNPLASAPEDGFAVAKAPDGNLTVAALGVFSSGELTKATLIITEADGVNVSGAKLQACFTPNQWSAGAKQAWADRPKAECETASAELKRNPTAGTWAGDVLTVLSAAEEGSTSASIMIVPGEEASAAFEVRFAAAELQVEEAESDSFSGGFGGSDFSSGSGGSGGSGGSDFSSEPSTDGSDFSSGADFGSSTPAPAAPIQDPAISAEPADVPEVEGSGDDEDTIGGGDFAISAARTGAGEATGNTAVQAVFFVVVALAAGAAAGFGRRLLRERLA